MKKASFLFLASFCFALPAFAQNTAQTTQTVKTIDTPAQVNVTINNTTTAQGNTQTTKVESSPAQPAVISASASMTNPSAGQNTAGGSTSLFGNYASSPYQSNIQVEMLRDSVWNALVPRKRLYDDPATGNSSTRYLGSYGFSTSSGSKYASGKGSQGGKKKSGNKQASGKQKASSKNSGTQKSDSLAAGTQNSTANPASEQTIMVVQKDGLLCIPLEQFEQLAGQKIVPNTAGSNDSVFYIPASSVPAAGTNPANAVNRNVSANAGNPTEGAAGTSSVIPAGSSAAGTNTVNPAVPARSAGGTSPVNLVNNGITPANSANPALGTSSAAPASSAGSVMSGGSVQSAAPAGGSANISPERDIFAIPANPFEPAASSPALGGTRNPAVQNPSGNTSPVQNPSGQNSLGQGALGQRSLGDNMPGQSPLGNNSMTQTPVIPPAPAGGNGSTGRDIGVTQGNSGTPNL